MVEKGLRQLFRLKILIYRCGNCREKPKSISSLADKWGKMEEGEVWWEKSLQFKKFECIILV